MKWIHIIGVCGKATSLVAKMFKDMGFIVTGSDAQFFSPASDYLKENNILTALSYSYKHLTSDYWINTPEFLVNYNVKEMSSKPDLCIMMSFLTDKNKEYRYAKLHNIPVWPYAKALGEYLVNENSIVVVGSAGKTTTTGLVAFMLESLGENPSYMVAAETNNLSDSIKNSTDTVWSVIEGDEYHNPNLLIEGKPKFMEYKPKYLVITNVGYEHQDIFKTQEEYLNAFKNLVSLVPTDGFIIARSNDANIDKVLENARCKVIRYGSSQSVVSDYYCTYTHTSESGPGYQILDSNKKILVEGQMNLLDYYNSENVLAAFILLSEFLESKKLKQIHDQSELIRRFKEIVIEFKGVKKRLELLLRSSELVVIDDFGVVADRAYRSLTTIKQHYPGYKIIAVFEPNAASRPIDTSLFNEMYMESFKYTDYVFIPSLTDAENLASQSQIIQGLKKLSVNAMPINRSDAIENISSIINNKKDRYAVVFFSSYRFTEVAHSFAQAHSHTSL